MADPQTPEAAEPQPEVQAFNATTATDEALYTEYNRVRAEGQELSAKTDADPAKLTELAAAIPALKAEIDARTAKAADVQAARDAFSTLPELAAPVPVIPESKPQEPAVTEQAPAPVAVPSVSEMSAQNPVITPTSVQKHSDTFGIHLSVDAAGALRRQAGDATDIREVAEAAGKLFSQFGQGARGSNGQKAERSLAQFTRDRGAELTLPGDRDGDMRVINHARNERRLDGGSLLKSWSAQVESLGDGPGALTAAAGWCAPSENRYELCSLWSTDGMLDLPTTTAPRGGINYTSAVTWAQINDAAITSFTKLTEAQVIANTAKNCTALPCPTFVDRRLDVAATCITGSFLQSVGYPEVVSTWTDGLLTRHAHAVNRDIIAQMVTQAGAAVVVPAQGAGGTGTTADTSAAASILSAVELAAEDMRYRSYMSFGTTFEVVLPHWVLVQIRADIARRNAWHADPFALANAQIVQWFSTRGIRPQFVYGWQDQQSGAAAPAPGDITTPIAPITALPTTVNFLIYPAGAVVLARQDVVTLTNVYDSTNLKQNLYTALFTEEGYAPIFPCGEIRQYTAQTCPSGATGHQVYTSCAAPAA